MFPDCWDILKPGGKMLFYKKVMVCNIKRLNKNLVLLYLVNSSIIKITLTNVFKLVIDK